MRRRRRPLERSCALARGVLGARERRARRVTARDLIDRSGVSEGTILFMNHVTVAKADVLDLVKELPDNVDVEDLIYRLYLREKLAAAEVDIAAGRTVSAAEARAEAASWQK